MSRPTLSLWGVYKGVRPANYRHFLRFPLEVYKHENSELFLLSTMILLQALWTISIITHTCVCLDRNIHTHFHSDVNVPVDPVLAVGCGCG